MRESEQRKLKHQGRGLCLLTALFAALSLTISGCGPKPETAASASTHRAAETSSVSPETAAETSTAESETSASTAIIQLTSSATSASASVPALTSASVSVSASEAAPSLPAETTAAPAATTAAKPAVTTAAPATQAPTPVVTTAAPVITTAAPTAAPVLTVNYSIDISELVKHPDALRDPQLMGLLDESGYVFPPTQVELQPDDSVLSVLERIAMDNNIQIDVENSYLGKYVKGIHYLYEKAAGPNSGWTYEVNGEQPQRSADKYKLQPGDVVVWKYVIGD